MFSGKVLTAFAFGFILSVLSAPALEAGFAVRLEKEVPRSAVTEERPITALLFASKTAASPVATQNFGTGELMVSVLDTLSGTPMYRVRMDFTNTDDLTIGMDLYWEFWLGGNMIGTREKIAQSAVALFAAEAATAQSANTAVTVTGTVAEANIDQSIARDSEVVNIVSVSNQFYSAGEVDAMLDEYQQDLSEQHQILRRNWLTLGPAELIETDNAGSAVSPRVAVDPSGSAVAVWGQSDGTRINIWANSYAAGSGWGTAGMIETDNAGHARNPKAAVDPSGNAVAVWHQEDGTRNNIWANIYTAGSGWGTAGLIETDDAGDAWDPQVAVDPSGNALAVWQQSDGTRINIWANTYTAGSGWGTAGLIETDDAGDAWDSQVAVDPSGNALAVWEQSDGTRDNIWANSYTAGSAWGAAEIIETDNAGNAWYPQVAFDASGNAVAVWQQSDGTRDNIWANSYTAGSGWGTAGLIETDDAGEALDPQVAVDPSGNAIVVWEQDDGTRYNIWANRYTAGSGWGTAGLIETDDAGGAGGSQVAVDPSGNAIAVWEQSDGTRNNIWASHYAPGAGWGIAGLIETDNAGYARNPQVAVDSLGTAVAVWRQFDGTRNNIWANRF